MREIGIPWDGLHEAVREYARHHHALGAYATRRDVRYLFLDEQGPFALCAERTGEPLITLAASYPLFDWDEREMREKQQVALRGHPQERALFFDGTHARALTAEGEGVSVIVVGPVHAGVIEPGRFTISSGGETVIHLDAQLSYSHRDIERALEGRDARDAAPLIARICGGCSAAHAWGYARALEALAGTACDEASELARLLFAELERVYNHLFDLASTAAGCGYGHGHTLGLDLKERALRICAAASGHRYLFDAIVPGGVREHVLSDPILVRAMLADLDEASARFTEELLSKPSVVRLMRGAGIVSEDIARRFGLTGPASRASGGMLDVRAYAPYGGYQMQSIRVAHADAGDVEARASVKSQELRESFRLLYRALDELGSARPLPPRRLEPRAGTTATVTEGPRGAETFAVTCSDDGTLSRMHLISASYRAWPVVSWAMEGNIVPDFPLVNKSFNLCYACADR